MVDVARVHQCQSITGNPKKWCHESLSGLDLMSLLERKAYLSDSPLNYYRYLLLEMDEALCAKRTGKVKIVDISNALYDIAGKRITDRVTNVRFQSPR